MTTRQAIKTKYTDILSRADIDSSLKAHDFMSKRYCKSSNIPALSTLYFTDVDTTEIDWPEIQPYTGSCQCCKSRTEYHINHREEFKSQEFKDYLTLLKSLELKGVLLPLGEYGMTETGGLQATYEMPCVIRFKEPLGNDRNISVEKGKREDCTYGSPFINETVYTDTVPKGTLIYVFKEAILGEVWKRLFLRGLEDVEYSIYGLAMKDEDRAVVYRD